MSDRIPLDTFYILVAQKLGGTATPTMARRYGEAIQEVIYEQLAQNDECYWYGLGNFEKTVSSRSGKYQTLYNIGNHRLETIFVEPKYVLGFDPLRSLVEALNNGEEKYPKKKKKRKYKPREYQEIRNERRRKEIEPLNRLVDRLVADAKYSDIEEEEIDDGEEGYDED